MGGRKFLGSSCLEFLVVFPAPKLCIIAASKVPLTVMPFIALASSYFPGSAALCDRLFCLLFGADSDLKGIPKFKLDLKGMP